MSNQQDKAYITMLTNDNYIYYALGLFESWKATKSKYPLYCCITENVSNNIIQILNKIGVKYIKIKSISLDKVIENNTKLGIYTNWNQALNKLNIFNLTQFKKCVWLDGDMLILQNIDELFDKPDFSSVEDSIPSIENKKPYTVGDSAFCSGMFVFSPSEKTYKELMELIPTLPKTIKWHDQNILAYYTRDWFKKPELHLPCEYELNMLEGGRGYLTYIKNHSEKGIKIKHYVFYKKAPLKEEIKVKKELYNEYLNYYSYLNNIITKYKLNIPAINIKNLKIKESNTTNNVKKENKKLEDFGLPSIDSLWF